MKYVIQFGIISLVCFVAEILYSVIGIALPSSIYGLIIMLILLSTKVIKLNQIEEVADFLVMIMPMMFVIPVVGIIDSVDGIGVQLVFFVLACIISTVVVIFITGTVEQLINRYKSRKSVKPYEGDNK